jgi:hypothetical protein
MNEVNYGKRRNLSVIWEFRKTETMTNNCCPI